MAEPMDTRSERYLRYSQRGMAMVLLLVLVLGIGGLALALRPDGEVAGSISRNAWLPVLAIVIAVVMLQSQVLRGDRWRPNSPEARAILQDEWRQKSLDRAQRIAFMVILAAQIPIALLLAHLPSARAVAAMAISTLTLGMATFIASYLVFSREASDG